ncbi:RNA polymerase sigma factor [Microcella humidisoli]|uniref:RNA polymerase sigma factor n=1 Tax=Microcella humidisoli TaxID=2963406 RepID=UPI0038991AFD
MSRGSVVSGSRVADVDQLVRRESADLLAYFARRVEQPADAADLLSDTLVVIWRRSGDVPRDPHDARLWSFGIARKVLSGHWRSRRRRADAVVKLGEELTTVLSESDQDSLLDVRSAVARLSELDREIVRLVYWEGFTLEETSRLLAMSSATVRSRHHRAKAKLAAELSEQGAQP